MAPFNSEARYEIKQRSGNKSELDGKEYLPSLLKCGHINHDKESPDYNNPDNGMRVTIWQECAYHMIHQPNPEGIGLSNENNMRAIRSNMQDLLLMGYDHDDLRKLIGEAIGQWEEWKRERLIQENIEQAHELNGCGEKNKEYLDAPDVEFQGMEPDCMYYIPDNAPMRKSKKRHKGYIPPAL